MKISKKKLLYLDKLVRADLIKGMKKYKIIEELKPYGITVDPEADIDANVLRFIFSMVALHILNKHRGEEGEYAVTVQRKV